MRIGARPVVVLGLALDTESSITSTARPIVFEKGIADHGKERAKIEANGVALKALAIVAASEPDPG